MKKIVFTVLFVLFSIVGAFAAKFDFFPVHITQPDGKRIACFASGDEFYHWLHDKDGYTIIQAQDGYFYYAKNEAGNIVPTKFRVGESNPSKLRLQPWSLISQNDYLSKRESFLSGVDTKNTAKAQDFTFVNNLCILIRFSDDSEFEVEKVKLYDSMFNAPTYSLSDFYKEVSYGKFTVKTYTFPRLTNENTYSYQSNNPRDYYRAYNATTNTMGYKTDSERKKREWTLLKDAVNWIDINAKVPESIDIDANEDGYVDNVSFIIRGKNDDWNSLLWAHRFSLPDSYGGFLNGKRVSTFIFQPEAQADRRTTCHEFFHALGAPDLYHYNASYKSLQPVGKWDVMEHGFGHMSAYMKQRYGNWLTIPIVRKSGQYSLKDLGTHEENSSLMFPIENTQGYQYIAIENRKKSGLYESTLPGEGLVVFRVNTLYDGNASYDAQYRLDMLYAFRPKGTPTSDGLVNKANLNQAEGRVSLNDTTSPCYLFQSRGGETNVDIYNVHIYEDSAVFSVYLGVNFDPSSFFTFPNGKNVSIEWKNHKDANKVMIISNTKALIDIPDGDKTYQVGQILPNGGEVVFFGQGEQFTDTKVVGGEARYYTIYSYKDSRFSRGLQSKTLVKAETVSCENLSNISASEALFDGAYSKNSSIWGYVSGHSEKKMKEFAEFYKFDGIKLMNAFSVNVSKAVAKHGEESKLTFWVALPSEQAKNIVGDRIYWQDVKINTLKEGINEIPCSAPVMLTGDFFLGYTITYSEENCDTFAVKMSVSKENRIETMYGKYIAAWYPISELIPQTKYSLAISPKLCTGNVNNPDYFIVFPSILQLKNIKGASGRIGVWTDLGKWEVANKPDWLDILADYGTGTLYVYTTSTSAKPRQANLTITVNGKSQNVQISQFKGAATEDLSSVNCKIYPNPSSTGLYSIELPMSTLYSIMDISGRVLCSGKIGSSVETIDLSSYNSGMYFIRFKDGNGYRVDKLIKK